MEEKWRLGFWILEKSRYLLNSYKRGATQPRNTTSSTASSLLFTTTPSSFFIQKILYSPLFQQPILSSNQYLQNGRWDSHQYNTPFDGVPSRKSPHLSTLPRHLPLFPLGFLLRTSRCSQQTFPNGSRYHQASIYRSSSSLLWWWLPSLLSNCRRGHEA